MKCVSCGESNFRSEFCTKCGLALDDSNRKNETFSKQVEELVEHKIRNTIIPNTRAFGIITGIIIAITLAFSGGVLAGIFTGIAYISSTLALVVLLDGFAEIITLLRKISEKTICNSE